MTGASKILTVSYGTFSCTLEGFDDPFNTMKAIAEYFRDLAADDRYFGAEPPTPDAAMLHRIAEREIHRRVEAKIQDNGVILRAGDNVVDAPQPAPVLPSVSPVDTDGVAARLQRIRARHAQQPAPEAPALPTTPAAAQEIAPVIEPVIEPVIAAPYLAAESFDDTYTEDEHADEITSLPSDRPADAAQLIDVPDQLVDILDAAEAGSVLPAAPLSQASMGEIDLSDEFSDLPEAEDFDIPSINLTDEADQPDAAPTSDDALLASLASEPAATPTPADETQDLMSPDDDIAAVLVDSAAEPSLAEAAEDDVAAPAPIEADSADISSATDEDDILSRLSGLDVASEAKPFADDAAPAADETLIETTDQIDADAASTPADPVPAPVKPQKARARVIRIRRVETPAQPVAPAAAAVAEIAATAPSSALSDEAEAALQAELAALEAELSGDLANDLAAALGADQGMDAAAATATAPEPTEQDASDADLDLGDLELADRERREQDNDQPAPAFEAAATVEEPAPALRHPLATPAADESLNRLIEHANTEMDGEDTRRRQSAIAHLKAAVAATAADRSATGQDRAEATRMEAYRNDLDRVVRPRRPVSDGTSTPRPEAPVDTVQRPTPLVLVSAQRIDRTPQAEPVAGATPRVVMPVRPRRVSAVSTETAPAAMAAQATVMQSVDHDDLAPEDILGPDEQDNVFADATSFQDFADQLGASALPDLLEAAAVYCAEVLQRPEFSRPLVMRQIAGLPGQSTTAREDYLRGFGTLLRQGRIAKVKRGMFALTDRSPYLAEARKQAS